MHRGFLIGFFTLAIITSGFAQNPKWAAWETEADTLMSREDFKGAIKLYSKVVTDSKLKDKVAYRALYKRAVAYYSSSNFNNSIKDISTFITEYPQNPQAHILRALSYRELNDVDNQLIDIEAALELMGGEPQIMKWRATLLMEKEEYELAKQDLLVVQQIQDDPEVEMNLAFAYYSLQNIDSALIAVNKAIELDATFAAAYLYGGSFALEAENYALALKYLDVALRMESDNTTALFYKGIALIELKRVDEGCRCLNQAFYAGVDDAADYLKQSCYEVFK